MFLRFCQILGISSAYLRYFSGMSWAHLGHSLGITWAYFGDTLGTPLAYLWHILVKAVSQCWESRLIIKIGCPGTQTIYFYWCGAFHPKIHFTNFRATTEKKVSKWCVLNFDSFYIAHLNRHTPEFSGVPLKLTWC